MAKGTLFRTKEGDLDFGWVLLIVGFTNGIVIFDLDALGIVEVGPAAWAFYGSVITMCFIAGVTISRARLIAKSDQMQAVADREERAEVREVVAAVVSGTPLTSDDPPDRDEPDAETMGRH
jgi:hypothetical protein